MDYETLQIEHVDAAYIKVRCERSAAMELSEYFTFMVPGARHMPSFKNKIWDGKIRLFNLKNNTIYAGLRQQIEEFAKEREYKIEYLSDFALREFSAIEAKEFYTSLNLPEQIATRDYQLDTFAYCVRNGRVLVESPTASGKSLMIYMLTKFYNKKTLIAVPTTALVHQMYSDFEEYGFDSGKSVHKIFAGQDKNTDKQVVVSTWQSIYELDKKWFDQFGLIIGDEAHLFKANSLNKIMTNLSKAEYRFGFTGSLDGTATNQMVLEGLFGRAKKLVTTSQLMDQGYLADLKIKLIVLQYPDETKQFVAKNLKDYKDELGFIVEMERRNRFIQNLALSLKGNTLVLYQFVERQGKPLYEGIQAKAEERKVFFIHGKVDGEERNNVRYVVNQEKDAIIVASYGTFSTGINIPNIHNIIFASPFKSKIKNLQSIGRALRLGTDKNKATLYDIADDLSWKSRKNFMMHHLDARLDIYNEEKFDYKIYTVKLGG